MSVKRIISSFFIFIALLCISNCGTNPEADAISKDINSIFDNKQARIFPPESKPEKPLVLRSAPIEKIVDNPADITVSIPKDKQSIDNKNDITPQVECTQISFLQKKTVSNLYADYLKNNKICQKIDNKQVSKHFIEVLVKHYSMQDVRILNADADFMEFYGTAIKNATPEDKMILNKQILEQGCHLLNKNPCILIKKYLY